MKQSEPKTKSSFSALAEFSIRRPITITMIFLSMVVIGLISSRMLPWSNGHRLMLRLSMSMFPIRHQLLVKWNKISPDRWKSLYQP